MMFVSFNSNTTGNTSRAETAYISRTHVFIPDFVVFVLLNLSFSVSCVLERPLVEQELLTFPEHMCSSRILWYSCCSIFRFLCNVLLIIVLSCCPLSFGHCIVCRCTASHYPVDIFKLFSFPSGCLVMSVILIIYIKTRILLDQ